MRQKMSVIILFHHPVLYDKRSDNHRIFHKSEPHICVTHTHRCEREYWILITNVLDWNHVDIHSSLLLLSKKENYIIVSILNSVPFDRPNTGGLL